MKTTHEETYKGFEVFVEANPDQNRKGFVWSVCKGDEELETGLAFSVDAATIEAREFIDDLLESDK